MVRNIFESVVDHNENKEKDKKQERINLLWHKYSFMGEAPTIDSEAYKHLFDICNKYIDATIKPRQSVLLRKSIGRASSADILGDAEDYFSSKRASSRMVLKDSSDEHKRELHNQIALMTTGKSRDDMDSDKAESIANYASELTTNLSLDQLEVLN